MGRMSEEERLNIIKDYVENGLSIVKLSQKYHRKNKTISNLLSSSNIEVKLGLRRKQPTSSQLEMIRDSAKQGQSYKQIAQNLGVSVQVVKRFADENDIKIHYTISPDLEENFFEKIDSEEKAYVLGFLFTDGCVQKNI